MLGKSSVSNIRAEKKEKHRHWGVVFMKVCSSNSFYMVLKNHISRILLKPTLVMALGI